MANQLNQLGASHRIPDGLEITGRFSLTGTDVDSHTDHRITVSPAIAVIIATGTTIHHPRCRSSLLLYPNFVAGDRTKSVKPST